MLCHCRLGFQKGALGSAGTSPDCSPFVLQIVSEVKGGGDKRATDGTREEFKKAIVEG